MKTFLINIRAEMLKTKRTTAVWLTLFAGAFVPIIMFIAAFAKTEKLAKIYGQDPWLTLVNISWRSAAPFLLPIYIILLCSLMAQIEFRNNTWKQVFASPRSYFDIYFSKLFIILMLILLSLGIFDLACILSGYSMSTLSDKFTFYGRPMHLREMAHMTLNIFISTLGIVSIQYWLSVRFKNFIVSFGIGLACMLTCMISAGYWEKSRYIPYLYPWEVYKNQTEMMSDKVRETLLYSLIIFAAVMLAGFADMVFRKEKA